MKVSRVFSLLLGAALLCVAAPRLRADDLTWKTTLHLTEPTEIPTKVLAPGDYIVKVINTKETRSIVQFLTPDDKVVATVLGVPNYRVKSAENTEFVYFQRIEGNPIALKSWVYPGNNFGIEFAYPKQEAMVLAEKFREPVYATPTPAEPTLQGEVFVVTPEQKEIPIAEYRPAAPMTKALPKTGSDLPLLGLLGVVSLAGAMGLRFLVRRES
jgi:LPXTG-motif cell wall-anchored protein